MAGVCTTDLVASELLTFNFKSSNSERNFAFSILSSDTSDDRLLKLFVRSDNDASTDLFEDKDSLRNTVIADIKSALRVEGEHWLIGTILGEIEEVFLLAVPRAKIKLLQHSVDQAQITKHTMYSRYRRKVPLAATVDRLRMQIRIIAKMVVNGSITVWKCR